jgi:hypothetical protein
MISHLHSTRSKRHQKVDFNINFLVLNDNTHSELDEMLTLTRVDSSTKPVRVNFVAKEPGLYKILWSNAHSWFNGKHLNFNIVVLTHKNPE